MKETVHLCIPYQTICMIAYITYIITQYASDAMATQPQRQFTNDNFGQLPGRSNHMNLSVQSRHWQELNIEHLEIFAL